ncbi:conjugal transfer protein TraH (plasmid) [Edwardsiella tarda]|uniref:conjugal transfer pilus assembly protein TraH n=1 Tax=Edwardsiella tarda TaxID=636 RepID=UPI000D508921|nr:conjugal transfer pilus assembly protein TraH [Edwardsiella tarda]UCQ29575.1 conjugal transfer protein TraH [Edwardsiella tarda]
MLKPRCGYYRRAVLACLLSAMVIHPGMADVNNDLNNFFNKLGFEGNATRAAVWQGQAAGYATGGSLFLRNQVNQLQIASFTPPSITAGCGGIDAYLGSFSFINSEQIERFVKQLMGNAAGYFFDLALQTAVPQMKSVKDFMQKLSTDLNSMNMSSCQAAQGIIGGLWPTHTVQSEKVCQDIAGETNMFADWAASRQGCTVGRQMDNVMSRAPENMKDQVMRNKNLMWDILKKNAMLNGNTELMELVMNVTGTLIFDNNGEVKFIGPQANHQDVVKALLYGGQATIFGCVSSGDCLKTTNRRITISANNGLNARVNTMISGISSKLRTDAPLTNAEKGFIESTSVPIMRYLVDPQMLNISSFLPSLSDYIAYDILLQYLRELLSQARIQAGSRNYPEKQMEQLQANFAEASRQLESLQSEVQVKSNTLMELEQRMRYLRQQVSTQLMGRYEQNYRYSTFSMPQENSMGGRP